MQRVGMGKKNLYTYAKELKQVQTTILSLSFYRKKLLFVIYANIHETDLSRSLFIVTCVSTHHIFIFVLS